MLINMTKKNKSTSNLDKKEMVGIYKDVSNICRKTDRENANVGHGPSSKLLQIAETTSKDFYDKYIVDPLSKSAIDNNCIYPHDASWASIGTTTCTFIPLKKFLEEGFHTGHGFIKTPKRIKTAAQLSCIALQANTSDQHGGQAYSAMDRDLSYSVKREYEWQLMNIVNSLANLGLIENINIEYVNAINDLYAGNIYTLDDMCDLLYKEFKLKEDEYNSLKKNYKDVLKSLSPALIDKIEKLAWENTERETYQAMEALVYNLNTMHSRSGGQTPFSSVNIGTDTSKEGRLIAKMLLLAYEKGLGKGEQPLFPNIIFKVKSGVNYEPDTRNFDLLLLALRVSTSRLFPTFSFQDATINKTFPEDVPVMGCRTRISWNVNMSEDKQTCEGRGNLSFTTLNLPNIALETINDKDKHIDKDYLYRDIFEEYNINIPYKYLDNENVKKFFLYLDKYIGITIYQLLQRFKYQCDFTKADFPFLMNGSWLGSEKLSKSERLYEVLKHGTLGIGFIGLAECLYALVGEHHGMSATAQKLGLEIIKFIDARAKDATEHYRLNFAVIATPAEGLTGKFVSKDKKIYGNIKGVTDKDWYTNSYHIPVEYHINIFDKIKLEGAYSKYCAGGSITYVELNESPLGNIQAYYKIIQTMYKADVVYGAINFPLDRCIDCGEFGIIEEECPVCKSKNISRIRRITGYLAEEENFNYAKKMETKNRVSHMKL